MGGKSLPPLTYKALTYTWRQLAQRLCIAGGDPQGTGFEGLDVSIHYARLEEVHVDGPSIIVVPCRSSWHDLLKRAPHSLDWIPYGEVVPKSVHPPYDDSIPVIFWGEGYEDGSKPFAEIHADGIVVFYADIIAATFFMLSRWEETVIKDRDEHERFPAKASMAYKQDFIDRPIVDEYASVMCEWLKVLLPGWHQKKHSFEVKFSHDIDRVRRFRNWYTAIRVFGGDILKRRSLKRAWRTSRETMAQFMTPDRTIYYKGIWHLASLSHAHGFSDDAFYFMAAKPGPLESDYDLSSPFIKRCIEHLREQGFEIGIHAGYHTFNNPERLSEEKARMDNVLGETEYGGRQHYLRFQAPHTWRHWEQVGLSYDSTMTYPDHEGFRCGTCHPFRPYDVELNRVLNVVEIPLIAMDRTLVNYRLLTPEQGEKRIMELAMRCKRVGGTFTLLWHNSSLNGEWLKWEEVYRRVVNKLSEENSY